MSRHQVAGLQVALYRYGHYAGPIDGIAGPMTRRAIVGFQLAAGLQADGVAGRRTRAALGRLGRPLFGARMLRRGMIGWDVSVLQFLLARRGFQPPSLNSNFGPVTERLVVRFQRKTGLAADGIVGPATRAALLGRPARARRSNGRRHVVRPGESLTSIAARHGTTVHAIARRNGIDPRNVLLVGARLVVPSGGGVAARSGSSPGPSSVTSSIARWGAHYGVDPSLVRALAWQESGFQNHVRSSAGAAGVMQVTPATWSFVELFVIGHPVPRTADGNVRVGVAFLAHLLRQFRGDVRLAIGAYHQGPASVREHGLWRVTRRFVANVFALRGRV
jgi:Transglycosylase SLT domain/Putative peptidoglycan binding domain/LysM domain